MTHTPISALIITKNEERYITRVLSSLAWVDEIIVIDAESTDRTVAICNDPKAPWAGHIKVITKPWLGFGTQRNISLKAAKHDWVFVVDADEECSSELKTRIQGWFENGDTPPHAAYKVRRIEYFLGKAIEHGCWNPSYQDRFFNRVGVEYLNEIHEYPRFQVTPQDIHEPLHHAPDFSIDRFLDKMNKYTTIEAKARVDEGQRTNPFRMLFAFISMFYKNYIYYRAYKDGIHGFTISILEGISRAVRHAKMWAYQRELKLQGKL